MDPQLRVHDAAAHREGFEELEAHQHDLAAGHVRLGELAATTGDIAAADGTTAPPSPSLSGSSPPTAATSTPGCRRPATTGSAPPP
jgi:hypothetical protein